MLSLTYVSTAREPLDPSDLIAMLEAIRPRNEALGITGMLLYNDGRIIQTLEGPEDVVEATFAAIEADTRHRGVTAVVRDTSAGRAFPDWSMGFRHVSRDDVAGVEGFNAFLQYADGADLEESGAAQHLLLLFRRGVRRQRELT